MTWHYQTSPLLLLLQQEGTVISAAASFRWDFYVTKKNQNTLTLREKRAANHEKERRAPRKTRANRGKTCAIRGKTRAIRDEVSN